MATSHRKDRECRSPHAFSFRFCLPLWTAHPKPVVQSRNEWLVRALLPCVSSPFSVLENREEPRSTVVQSRNRGRTLKADSWMPCVSLGSNMVRRERDFFFFSSSCRGKRRHTVARCGRRSSNASILSFFRFPPSSFTSLERR